MGVKCISLSCKVSYINQRLEKGPTGPTVWIFMIPPLAWDLLVVSCCALVVCFRARRPRGACCNNSDANYPHLIIPSSSQAIHPHGLHGAIWTHRESVTAVYHCESVKVFGIWLSQSWTVNELGMCRERLCQHVIGR